MKFKKRRKSSRFRGSHTHGRGGKKKARGSGHRGGFGMAGTGKRADQRKTLILNMPEEYFGSDKTLRKKLKRLSPIINLSQIQSNLPSFVKTGKAKESSGVYHISLPKYKILSDGEFTIKAKIAASSASQLAIEKVRHAGGEIIISRKEGKKESKKEDKK